MSITKLAAEDVELFHALLARLDASYRVSSEALEASRSHVNDLLFSGTVQITAGTPVHKDFTIPFLSIAWADPNGIAPGFSTGQGGELSGVGVIAPAQYSAACVPFVGRAVTIEAASSGTFFLAIFSRPRPFTWAQLAAT